MFKKKGFMNMEAMECEMLAQEVRSPMITSLDDLQEEEDDASTIAAKEEAEEVLMKRKKCELELIKKYDRTEINTSKECWFLIDSKWLNAWSAFVNDPDEDEPPGCLSTKGLLTSKNDPLEGLKTPVDYRAVTPMIYHIFLELYGKDESPELPRYLIDIYKLPVPLDKLSKIKRKAINDAAIKVNKIRTQWMKWDRPEDEDEYKDYSCCCGWVTREHLEAFIYWAITCWSRKKSGRGSIKYRNYQPLRNDGMPDDSDHSGIIDTSTHSTVSIKSTGSVGSVGSTSSKKSLAEKRDEFEVDLDDDPHSHSDKADKDYERGLWANRLWGSA